MNYFQYFGILYGIYWAFWLAGFFIVRSGTVTGRKLGVFTWNSRIRLWNRQPVYERLFTAMEEKKYFPAAVLVMLFNLPMLVIQFAAGLLLLSPLLAAYAGTLVGLLTGQGKRKGFFIYALSTLIFEFGAFAFAGAVGMTVGDTWILSDITFIGSFGVVFDEISLYVLLPFACLVFNGLFEASGPLLGIDGVPGIEAYRKQIFRQINPRHSGR